MRVFVHRPVPTDRAGESGHVILLPERDWPVGLRGVGGLPMRA